MPAFSIKSRWLLNLGLAALVALLVAVLVYRPGAKKPAILPTLTALPADTITRIRIAETGRPEIDLEKVAGQWRITAPVRARANGFNVEAVLRIAAARVEKEIPSGDDKLSAYGLAPPRARVWLNDQEIRFGSMHPLESLRYVAYQGRIALISAFHYWPISNPYPYFISPRLLPPERKPVALQLPGFRLTLKGGSWQLRPENRRISGDAINDFVDRWRYASAMSVDRYSGRPILDHVRIHFTDGMLDLGILAYKPEFILYRKDEGLEYHFPQEVGRQMLHLAPPRGS